MSRKDACEKWERQRREEREAATAAMGTCRRAVLLNLVFIAIESHLNNFGLLFDRFVLLKFNLLVGKQLNASICYVNVSLSLSLCFSLYISNQKSLLKKNCKLIWHNYVGWIESRMVAVFVWQRFNRARRYSAVSKSELLLSNGDYCRVNTINWIICERFVDRQKHFFYTSSC